MTPTDLGDTIRRERKQLGLRQDELAAVAGVGLRFLVELERGKPTAEIGRALQVIAALGLDFEIVARADGERVWPQ